MKLSHRLAVSVVLTTSTFLLLNLQSISALECSNWEPPVLTANYSPKGIVLQSAGMETYETGPANSSRALIAVFDIYGFTPVTNNIYQICDRLSEFGYRVIMPDFFHGQPWKAEHYPFPNDKSFKEFVRQTSWNESVRDDLGLVLQEYKSQNVSEFGIFGFCFGGKISAHAVDLYSADIKVAGQFHPAGADVADARLIKSPSILQPGANDPDMTEYCEIINTNLGNGSCVYDHKRDVNHGYAGGTANWSNETIRMRAEEAVGMLEQFLCTHFPAS